MSYALKIKNSVMELRLEGKTYTEIAKALRLKVPKSTLSEWCKSVVMPSWYQEKIQELNKKNFSKAQKLSIISNRIKQDRLHASLLVKNKHLSRYLKNKDIAKMLLSILYLGEGAKWKSHRGLMLGSSDLNIIQLYVHLLKACYGIDRQKLRFRISYRADQNLRKLERYWAQAIGVPLAHFYKTIPDSRTRGKFTRKKDYKGVCVITCGGTEIQQELEIIPKIILAGR